MKSAIIPIVLLSVVIGLLAFGGLRSCSKEAKVTVDSTVTAVITAPGLKIQVMDQKAEVHEGVLLQIHSIIKVGETVISATEISGIFYFEDIEDYKPGMKLKTGYVIDPNTGKKVRGQYPEDKIIEEIKF